MRTFVAATVLCLVSGIAYASAPPSPTSCNSPIAYDFLSTPVLKKVKGGREKKVYFLQENPISGEAKLAKDLKEESYLLGEDSAIELFTLTNKSCVLFPKGRSETVGFVPTNALEPITEKPLNISQWKGTWINEAGSVDIEDGENGGLHVTGQTVLELGSHETAPHNIHIGDIDSQGVPKGNFLELKSISTCEVRLYHFGELVIIQDNFRCGGAEVSFSGIYRKK